MVYGYAFQIHLSYLESVGGVSGVLLGHQLTK